MEFSDKLAVYSFIFQYLNTKPSTFKEIVEEIENSSIFTERLTLSKMSFHRYLPEIKRLFGVEIDCDNFNRYYISEQENSFLELDKRLYEYFNIFKAISTLKKMNGAVFVENRFPNGLEKMGVMVKSIIDSKFVRFDYAKYDENLIKEREVKPYALKEARGRWYLVAEDCADSVMKTFGIDRISRFQTIQKSFSRKKYNIEESFSASFGIDNSASEEIQLIRVKAQVLKSKFIASYPLHHSQKIEIQTDNYTIFSFKLKITKELIMEILSHSEELEVLEPPSLKNKIHEIALKVTSY